jgi:hypothetical protein
MKLFRTFSVAVLALGFARAASAQAGGPTATQDVTFSVTDVNVISVSADPAALSAAAGGADATDASTTYSVTTNSATAKKITGYISGPMPTGTTLSVSLADPDGVGSAVSAGSVALTATTTGTAQDLVTGIAQVSTSGSQISYTLHADVTAAAASGLSRVVTFTIQ